MENYLTFTWSVDHFCVPLLIGLTGHYDVLNEVVAAGILELLVDVLAAVAHLRWLP